MRLGPLCGGQRECCLDREFGGDEAKRRAFISWVEAELDRRAVLLTERFRTNEPLPLDWLMMARESSVAPRPVGAPTKPNGWRAVDGMDAADRQYMLLR